MRFSRPEAPSRGTPSSWFPWLSLVVFYGLNGIDLDAPDDEAYDLVIAIASGTATYQEVSARLASWH